MRKLLALLFFTITLGRAQGAYLSIAFKTTANLMPELPPDFLDTDLSNRRHSW